MRTFVLFAVLAFVAVAFSSEVWPHPPSFNDDGPFTLDLSKSSANRWTDLITHAASDINAAIAAAVSYRSKNPGTWAADKDVIMANLDSFFGAEGAKDLNAIAGMTSITHSLEDLVYFNILMEFNLKGSMAVLKADHPSVGTMEATYGVLGETVTKDLVQPLLFDVRVTGADTDIDTIIYAGTVGFRAIATSKVAATKVVRHDTEIAFETMIHNLVNDKSFMPSTVLRECSTDGVPDFAAAVDCLSNTRSVADLYYAVAGVSATEGRTFGTHRTIGQYYTDNIRDISAQNWYLVQTDYQHTETMTDSDAGRTASLESGIDELGSSAATPENLAKELKKYPVRSIDAVWSVTAQPSVASEWAPLLQQCEFIYDGAEIVACVDPPMPMNWFVFALSVVIILAVAATFVYGRKYNAEVTARLA